MNHAHLHIANRRIGTAEPVFIIAEIGVNHDGCPETALRLVEAAAAAGADAVKLQLFSANRLLHRSAALAGYQQAAGAASAHDLLRQYELPEPAVVRLVDAIRAAGLVPLATPFSPEDVEQVARLGLPAVKLASPDLVNPLLLDAAAALDLPLLLSTGAATLAEIDWAVVRCAVSSVALLHCVSAYPTPTSQASLATITRLTGRYDLPIGYSDHTQSLLAGAAAVMAGACIIEKHLTHDRAAPGPDHAASADPEQFREYIARIREAEQLRGTGEKVLQEIEHDVRSVSRQSLVARRTIHAGERITRDHLTCQRPGTGIPAMELDTILGTTARREIPAGEMLWRSDLVSAMRAA